MDFEIFLVKFIANTKNILFAYFFERIYANIEIDWSLLFANVEGFFGNLNFFCDKLWEDKVQGRGFVEKNFECEKKNLIWFYN